MSKKAEFKSNKEVFKQAMQETVSKTLTELGIFVQGRADHELNKVEPRRVDTGHLRQSIVYQVNENEQSVTVGTNVEYAIYVHEGTRKMAPNRFLKNAVVKNEQTIQNHIKKRLKGTAGTLEE